MADASSSNPEPGSLVGFIQGAGLAATPEVVRLQDFAAAVQEHRFESRASPWPGTTRSTALWSAMYLDEAIRQCLEDSKTSMEKLAQDLSLTTEAFTAQPATSRLHDDFADAINEYLRQRAISGPVRPAEVVLAILQSARDATRGVVHERVPDVEAAIRRVQGLLGAASPPTFDPQEFSGSVRELRRTFADDPTVTAGGIATELQRSEAHGDYAAGAFMRATYTSTGTGAPFEEWCRRVRGLYDMELVRSSRHQVIDGRLFLLGLAALDVDLAEQLGAGGVLDALRAEVSVSINREPLPSDLKGGVSREYVDPTKGIALEEDRLGVATYVSMLATVICDPDTPPPLSVGVFGEWGSGKSFFMGLLRGQVEQISSSEDDRYLHDIRQISFNAWHYADSNLWASLGDEIFRQLLQEEDPDQERQEKLRAELGELITQRRELEAVAEHAEAEAVRLRTQIAKASSDRDAKAKDLLKAMEGNEEFQDQLAKIWRRLGIRDPIERARVLAEEVRGTATEAALIRRSLAEPRGVALAVAAVLVLLLVVGVAVWPGSSLESMVQAVTAAIGTFLGAAVAVAAASRRGLTRLRKLMDQIRADTEKQADDRTANELVEPFQELRKAETAQDLAHAQLATVVDRVAELGRELADLAPGQRLYSFLADRVEAGDYSRNLGLISTIRKDFERLITLMAEWREERMQQAADTPPADGAQPAGGDGQQAEGRPDPAKRPIDRIVLYIDDLDRCSPQQVVEVLQAVHLLMALDLFVVVVGVDPRWLVRSLQEKYPKLLDSSDGRGGADDEWDASPEDYLEKIFGIPLVLPGMAKGTLDGILRGIMGVEQPVTGHGERLPQNADAGAAPTDQPSIVAAAITTEDDSELDALTQPDPTPPSPPLPLSNPEITLLAALEPLVATPREAKRLANVYRMVRATRNLSPASRFMGDDGQPGEYEAVVLLLGLLTAHGKLLGAILDAAADAAAKRPGGLMARAATETWAPFVAGMEPRRNRETWSNDFVATMTTSEQQAWHSLWAGLQPVSEQVTLRDLTALQAWAPSIRRFSFVMSPAS